MPWRRFLLLVLVLAAVGSGACGGDDQPDLARLEGGVARGPGFEFKLSEEWSGLADNDRRELFAEYGKKELPALDLGAGFLAAGLWIKPEARDERPSVNVVVEPITSDSPVDAVVDSSLQPVEQQGKALKHLEEMELDGEPAGAYRFSKVEEKGVARTGLIAVHEDLGYTVTAQLDGRAAEAQRLLEEVARSWRWVEPEGKGREELDSLSRLTTDAYEVTLPPGWRATRASTTERLPPGVNEIWRGHLDERFATNVTVARAESPQTNLRDTVRKVIAEERALARTGAASGFQLESLRRGSDVQLGGDRAGSVDLVSKVSGVGLRQLEVVALHDGSLHRLTLSSRRERFPRDRDQFLEALKGWSWR